MTFRQKFIQELVEWAKSLAFALIIGLLILVFARPSFIIGPSMEPTFHDKTVVLVEKISYMLHKPERFDIVVAKTTLPLNRFMNKSVIKRIVGLPGDHVVVLDGSVYVNDELVLEPYIKDGYTDGTFDGVVPDNHYFIMGDNRLNSNDSRKDAIGYVPFEDIKGKVYFRVFPFPEFGTI